MDSYRFWKLLITVLHFSVYVNGAFHCMTGGREVDANIGKKERQEGMKKPLARVVDGKWVLLKDLVELNHPSTQQKNVSTQQCCALSCRSKIVPTSDLGRAPYRSVVHLFFWTKTRGLYCSGTIIAPQVVLTAAHCVRDTDSDPILAGFVRGKYVAPGNHTVVANVRRFRFFKPCRKVGIPDYALLLLATNPKIPVLNLIGTLKSTKMRAVSVIGFPDVEGVSSFGKMLVDTIQLGNISVNRDYYFEQQLISGHGGSGGPFYAHGSGASSGVFGVATYLILRSGITCPATQRKCGGPGVEGNPFSVKELLASIL